MEKNKQGKLIVLVTQEPGAANTVSHRLIIPATQNTEAGKSQVQGLPELQN